MTDLKQLIENQVQIKHSLSSCVSCGNENVRSFRYMYLIPTECGGPPETFNMIILCDDCYVKKDSSEVQK